MSLMWKLARKDTYDPEEFIGVFVSHGDALEIAKERVADWLEEGEEPVVEHDGGVTSVATTYLTSMYEITPLVAFSAQGFREHRARMEAESDAYMEQLTKNWGKK